MNSRKDIVIDDILDGYCNTEVINQDMNKSKDIVIDDVLIG
jgi:hypothetical protein